MNDKILLISIPKAGTYFVSEVLKNLGWKQSFMHLNLESYEDYSGANHAHALKDPQAYRVHEKISRVLDRLPGHSFAVGHLPASNRQLVKGGISRSHLKQKFRLIFLVRDLRRCVISHMNFDVFMRGQYPALKDKPGREMLVEYLRLRENFFYRTYKGLLPWIWESGVNIVRYESLLDGTLADLAGATGVKLQSAIHAARGTDTLTRSAQDSSPDQYWSDEAQMLYRRRIQSLNRLLGYDFGLSGGASILNPLRNLIARTYFHFEERMEQSEGKAT